MPDAMWVDMAVAFTLDLGVPLVEEHLRDVANRGGRIRLLTGETIWVQAPLPRQEEAAKNVQVLAGFPFPPQYDAIDKNVPRIASSTTTFWLMFSNWEVLD